MTSILLGISALIGISILGTDNNLWTVEPSHAYGLIVFVVIDIIGIGLLSWKRSRSIIRLGAVWGALFALIQVSDIFSGGAAAFGLSQSAFAAYLFGLGYYDSSHIAFLNPALFVVNILVAVVGFWESRRAMGMAPKTGTAQPMA